MMQTTQPRHRDNLLAGVQTYRFPASRSLFVQAEMGSVVVIITDIEHFRFKYRQIVR